MYPRNHFIFSISNSKAYFTFKLMKKTVKTNGHDLSNKNMSFSTVPYFKDYLKQQIESAGGIVYNNFENVPTNKYRTCFLLAPFPCITAKYVQCLASNITVNTLHRMRFFRWLFFLY